MRINHNIASLNTYRQLTGNTTATGKSLEKLSSGLRINRAGDDAAGLAISEKMRGQIRGLDQAARNSQDGISLIQTAEGALNETHSILQRMRELAVQSANDTNTSTDRGEIQKEVDQLAVEITRIANNTEFNTQKLLNGGIKTGAIGADVFQIGANSGQSMSISINAMDADSLGVARDVKSATLAAGAVGITAASVGTSPTIATGTYSVASADVAATAAGAVTVGGLTFTASAGAGLNGYTFKTGTVADGTAASASVDTVNKVVTINGDFDNVTTAGMVANGALQTQINTALAGNGITQTITVGGAAVDGTATAQSSAALAGGTDASLTYTLLDGGGATVETLTSQALNATSVSFTNGLALTKVAGTTTGLSASVTIGTVAGSAATFANGVKTADAVAEGGIDISSSASVASNGITVIDNAIQLVSAERSKLGAVQNRLEHTINNLGTSSENLTAAESRIRDVDMAKEMMEFTKNNILSQAAQAMLAQANQQPQGVLQLLR